MNGYWLGVTWIWAIAALPLLVFRYVQIICITTLMSRQRDRLLLYATPLACFALIFVSIDSAPLLEGLRQLSFFVCAAWYVIASMSGLVDRFIGLSPRDDVAERRNHAAAWTISGAHAGLAFCVVGPGTQLGAVSLCVFLALPLFFFLVWVYVRVTDVGEAITVERDGGAGIRVAGFLAALGLLLGQAVVRDPLQILAIGPPVAGLAGLFFGALKLETICRRDQQAVSFSPRPRDLVIVVAYLLWGGIASFPWA